MNPQNISDARPFVWTVSRDKAQVAVGKAYCIYLHGRLHLENLDLAAFLKAHDELHSFKIAS